MGVHGDQPSENSEGYRFRACYSRRVGHCHLHLAETQRPPKEREGFRGALMEALGNEAGGSYLEVGCTLSLVRDAYLPFSGPAQVGSWIKVKEAVSC